MGVSRMTPTRAVAESRGGQTPRRLQRVPGVLAFGRPFAPFEAFPVGQYEEPIERLRPGSKSGASSAGSGVRRALQGYLAHKKTSPLGPRSD